MRKLLILSFLLFSGGIFAQTKNVLFIGNSYTHYNGMPKMFEFLAKSKGKDVYADSIAVSNSTLKLHTERETTWKKLKSRTWDVVFIQAFSREFAQDSATIMTETMPYAKMIIDSIKKYSPCADLYLYMTWGYEDGYGTDGLNNSYEKMQANVRRGYFQASNYFHIPIAPVGMVWQEMRKTHPEIPLYRDDHQHPNPSGSFIAACTFFASIWKESPVGGNAPATVQASTVVPIEQLAARIVLNNLSEYNLDTIQHPALEIPPLMNFTIREEWTKIEVTNHTNDVTNFYWDFGDGNGSKKANPVHYYKESGTYTVTQVALKACQEYVLKKRITVSTSEKYATSNPKKKHRK